MTDLEMTRLCAEAMGIATEESFGVLAAYYKEGLGLIQETYDPLHDDAQAMALVKRFELRIDHNELDGWRVSKDYGFKRYPDRAYSGVLNRAIVECVAGMIAARR